MRETKQRCPTCGGIPCDDLPECLAARGEEPEERYVSDNHAALYNETDIEESLKTGRAYQ